MHEYLDLQSPNKALEKFLNNISFTPSTELVPTMDALGRVVSSSIKAPHPLPEFRRSTVDGYAVDAETTFGASESLPLNIQVLAEVNMGEIPGFKVGKGECALIHTGGMLPEGTNSVVMLEFTQLIVPGRIEIYQSTAYGENVIQTGEDVLTGEVVIPEARKIRSLEIGGLLALGITELIVNRRPVVGIISTGDELISPEYPTQPGKVRDINSYSLSVLVQELGGIPVRYGIIRDDFDLLEKTAKLAFSKSDLLLITAGSSASARDITSQIIELLGSPGIIVHGINIRPGKPTILAVCEGKPVIGLPGNPVSAMVIAFLYLKPAIEKLSGLTVNPVRPRFFARLSTNISSSSGREDWVAVRLFRKENMESRELLAEPIFSKSNLIFSLVRADALARIPPEVNGMEAGQEVELLLL